MIIFTLVVLFWIIAGPAGFIYWWTTEYDFTHEEVLPALLAIILGPFSWLIGYALHGNTREIIFKRRK